MLHGVTDVQQACLSWQCSHGCSPSQCVHGCSSSQAAALGRAAGHGATACLGSALQCTWHIWTADPTDCQPTPPHTLQAKGMRPYMEDRHTVINSFQPRTSTGQTVQVRLGSPGAAGLCAAGWAGCPAGVSAHLPALNVQARMCCCWPAAPSVPCLTCQLAFSAPCAHW